jgi:FRG domain
MKRHAFFERVAKAKKDLEIIHPYKGVWFRGVKQGRYECIPSFFRYEYLVEANLMARFVREGVRYLQPNSSKWEILAFMQHHGVPTKLLDWSTDITSAIYFALVFNVEENEKLENPHVWVLNPFRLNQHAYGKRVILDNMDEVPPYQPDKISETKWPYKMPIAIALNWYNSRIAHQQGVFTYHGGRQPIPIDDNSNWAKRVVIQDDEIRDLIQHLRDAGISHDRIFQSPDHLGKDIKESSTGKSILWNRNEGVSWENNEDVIL